MKELLNLLFEQYQGDVYLYLFSLCHDAALAEDLTAETFLQVVQSLHRFRGDSDEKTWLFSIARHCWYSYLRKKKTQPPTELLDELLENHSLSPEQQVCVQDAAQRVQELLDAEPERNRQIVMLRLNGLSFFEIGQRVGITENSARVIDFRVKAKIREQLRKEHYIDA